MPTATFASDILEQGNLAQNADETKTLDMIEAQINQNEKRQFAALDTISTVSASIATRQKQALISVGLQPDKLTAPTDHKTATGGPFIPLKNIQNGSPFEQAVYRAQKT